MPRRRRVLAVLAAAVLLPVAPHAQSTQSSTTSWAEQYRALPQPSAMKKSMRRLSARPHHVGSPYDKDNAEWIAAQFKRVRLGRADRDVRRALPDAEGARARAGRADDVHGEARGAAGRRRPDVEPEQPSSCRPTTRTRTTAMSPAPLVYVNYGVPADYEELERRGISVKGAIVIAQYGGSWRGIKPKVAAEHGAIGCLIYSDPRDDGYGDGRRVPEGPDAPERWRAARQRGGHADVPRRSAHARRRRDARREASADRRGADASRRSRCCRSRTATRSRCSRRSSGPVAPAELARRACRSRIASARARAGPPEAGVQLGHSSRCTT